MWILPLAYAVWAAFHPAEFTTRFELMAPLTLSNFERAIAAAPFARYFLNTFILVTLILAFLFLGPRFIDFGDKPVANVPLRSTEVLVKEAGSVGSRSRFIYEIRADQQRGFPNPDQTELERHAAILRVIEPIAGEVTLDHYDEVRDAKGKIVAYDAWILR